MEQAIEAEYFAPIRETLINLTMKSAKYAVQLQYPDLNLDFLKIDVEEIEDTQSGTTNLGAKGQKITLADDEAINQASKDNNDDAGTVDIYLLDE